MHKCAYSVQVGLLSSSIIRWDRGLEIELESCVVIPSSNMNVKETNSNYPIDVCSRIWVLIIAFHCQHRWPSVFTMIRHRMLWSILCSVHPNRWNITPFGLVKMVMKWTFHFIIIHRLYFLGWIMLIISLTHSFRVQLDRSHGQVIRASLTSHQVLDLPSSQFSESLK